MSEINVRIDVAEAAKNVDFFSFFKRIDAIPCPEAQWEGGTNFSTIHSAILVWRHMDRWGDVFLFSSKQSY